MMVPDPDAVSILLEVGAEPFGDSKEPLFAFDTPATAPKVVAAQAVLRNRDRVVLQADVSVIVELRDALYVVGAPIVGLFREWHVVFAEFGGAGVRIFCGSFVPEGEMAIASEEVGTEDSAVVGESWQGSKVPRSRFQSAIHGTTAGVGINSLWPRL